MDLTIETKNWTTDLANKIESAEDGDRIICHTDSMIELGKSALSRMRPDKKITFVIKL